MRDDETEGCRKIRNEEIHNNHSTSYIVSMAKSRQMKRFGMWHTWYRWKIHTKFWLGSLKGRDHTDNQVQMQR
jgi:hypothetical protein